MLRRSSGTSDGKKKSDGEERRSKEKDMGKHRIIEIVIKPPTVWMDDQITLRTHRVFQRQQSNTVYFVREQDKLRN